MMPATSLRAFLCLVFLSSFSLLAKPAAIAALAFVRCPQTAMITCLLLLLLGSMALAFVVYGPKDYLLRVPASFVNVLHPWILGLVGLLSVVIGGGGLAGLLVRRLMCRSTTA